MLQVLRRWGVPGSFWEQGGCSCVRRYWWQRCQHQGRQLKASGGQVVFRFHQDWKPDRMEKQVYLHDVLETILVKTRDGNPQARYLELVSAASGPQPSVSLCHISPTPIHGFTLSPRPCLSEYPLCARTAVCCMFCCCCSDCAPARLCQALKHCFKWRSHSL